MKFTILAFIFLFVIRFAAYAQNTDSARMLVKEGIILNDARKYPEAIAKYALALKVDTGYLPANYQLAFSLFSSDRGTEGLPYLQKVIASNGKLTSAAYDLAGLIYFKNKQYAEAEKNAIEAIKLDLKHAGTVRMYALVCFHQNKRAAALLGFCSFILLEPNIARSMEAFGNIKHILQGGALKPGPGEKPVITDADTDALNLAITRGMTSAGAQHTAGVNPLVKQLTVIFITIGQLAAKQSGNNFFRNYMAAYFYKLAQSPNMEAFAKLLNASSPENVKWINENQQQMTDLDNWVKGTERTF